jgi:tRNA (cmo5U34)-methyltransferase
MMAEGPRDQAATLRAQRPREDWFDEGFVSYWIDEQAARANERQRQFVRIRALVPKLPEQQFRYINLGAGPGHLDEVLLAHFPNAQATLLDGSPGMLQAASERLKRFESRAEYVQADLATPDWTRSVAGPFDIAVSSIALHNLRQPSRIRQLYAEVCELITPGGAFINLDYVRLGRVALTPLAALAAKDPDAQFTGARGGGGGPGTVEEQLGWLREAGFACAECFWKEWQVAILAGFRDPIQIPVA